MGVAATLPELSEWTLRIALYFVAFLLLVTSQYDTIWQLYLFECVKNCK